MKETGSGAVGIRGTAGRVCVHTYTCSSGAPRDGPGTDWKSGNDVKPRSAVHTPSLLRDIIASMTDGAPGNGILRFWCDPAWRLRCRILGLNGKLMDWDEGKGEVWGIPSSRSGIQAALGMLWMKECESIHAPNDNGTT